MIRKGWFIIPGVQDGDRTLSEQMLGVSDALAEANGKLVLDMGCAEGLISKEFLKAGAAGCFGLEAVADHIAEANRQCAGLNFTAQQVDLQLWCSEVLEGKRGMALFDIVLALGVCHKFGNPGDGIRFAARSARDLVLVRMHARSEAKDGYLRSKFAKQNVVSTIEIMEGEGFKREKVLPGPREETVWWWRRS